MRSIKVWPPSRAEADTIVLGFYGNLLLLNTRQVSFGSNHIFSMTALNEINKTMKKFWRPATKPIKHQGFFVLCFAIRGSTELRLKVNFVDTFDQIKSNHDSGFSCVVIESSNFKM